MNQAWAFYRRSTDKQELSIDDQRKACQEYAASRGWTIIREFLPQKGYGSGLTIDRDPEFQEMIRVAEMQKHGASWLLVYDVSRFGRLAAEDKIFWEQRFKRAGLRVVYVKDDFKNDDSLGDVLSKVVKHAEAHEYSRKLSQTTVRGCKSHAGLGRSCGGRPPFGFSRLLVDSQHRPIRELADGERKAEKTQHVVWTPGDPAKIEIVRSIFQAYARGNGLGAIVDDLNSRGVPAPHGGQWAKNAVLSMLKNPAYVGTRVYFKHNYHDRTTTEKKRVRPAEEWIKRDDAHPAIVERSLFEQVQARFQKRKPRDGRHYDSPYLLSGMIQCARCGHRYYGQMKYHEGRKSPYYLCGGYHNKGKHFCAAYSVQAATLEDVVLTEIQERVSELRDTKLTEERCRELLQETTGPGVKERLAELNRAVAAKEAEIRNVVAAIRMGNSGQALVEALTSLEGEKKRLLAEVQNLTERTPGPDIDPAREAHSLAESFEDLNALLAEGTVQERKELIREFIQGIEVLPEAAQARFTFRRLPFLEKRIASSMGAGDSSSFRRDGCGGWI